MTGAIVAVCVAVLVCTGAASSASHCQPRAPASSCGEIKVKHSGYYVVATEVKSVYCSTEELCGSKGWTGVGIADFADPQMPCPDPLVEYSGGGLRGCRRLNIHDNSVIIPIGISYSQVCGKVQGYQYTSPDAFNPVWTGPDNIEEYYFDGVSITHGPVGARQHIFSLAAANTESVNSCPCSNGSTTEYTVPSFVGQDYFCESGNPMTYLRQVLYMGDILWDGEQCGGNEGPCCTSPYKPYFYKDLGSATTDNIELRILTDQALRDEDILLLSFEIYIK